MKKIIKLSAIVSAILIPQFAQSQATSPMEVSATVEPGCFISAENINFGNLITPITIQTAQSNMQIHCSNNIPLKITINYSNSANISGEGKSVVTAIAHFNYSNAITYILKNNGEYISERYKETYGYDIWCHASLGVAFHNISVAQAFGYSESEGSSWRADRLGVCSGMYINTSYLSKVSLSPVVNVGSLTGNLGGEKIIYSLEVPGKNTTVWNTSNDYRITSNGQIQTIPMKANINASGNPTHHMTPDTYQDTLTVVLTY